MTSRRRLGTGRGRVQARAAAAVVALAAVTALAACSSGGAGDTSGFVESDPQWVTVGAADRADAPSITGDVLGADDVSDSFDLAEQRGHVVVVNVWGSWCSPCRAEADTLQAVYEEFAPDGVVFVGLNTRDNRDSALGFLRSHGVTYPNLDDTGGALQMGFRSSLPAGGIPTTWVIDADGRVAARSLGEVTVDGLRRHISAVLAESATPSQEPMSAP
jgi:thiol-disulfide isomerase/thioredoxin